MTTGAPGTMKAATLLCAAALLTSQRGASGFQRRRPGWKISPAAPTAAGGGARSTTTVATSLVLFPRGGSDGGTATKEAAAEQSLDDRVNAAMRRLGLVEEGAADGTTPPPPTEEEGGSGMNCDGGVCTLEPSAEGSEPAAAAEEEQPAATEEEEATGPSTQEEIYATADRISSDMSVPRDIALAALYSSFSETGGGLRINEEAARSIVQAEVDAISSVPEECDEVSTLVGEGHDAFLVRRSLAFSDMDVDNARAILLADREDEEAEVAAAEERARAEAEEEKPMKTVTVDYPKDFDPLAGGGAAAPQQQQQQAKKPEGAPPPAKKEDVVFEGTVEDLQKLVIESPVPVLLDVYADWCGPCKQLTPALEQICVNAGGMLRLVKVNTDMERQILSALEVKSLPTVFGIRDGKILNMFMGLPRDERMIRDFLMGLMVPGQEFNPPVTAEDRKRYDELSGKLLKLAAGASFSFSARERLQSHVAKLLDDLVEGIGGETGMAVADDSARVLRSLLSNVIANPFEEKYRRIKLDNKVIADKVAKHGPCLSILKSVGFAEDGESALAVAKGKRVVNIAPFVVGRDCIDKWIDRNRYHIAAAGRKRKDEAERARLAAEAEEAARNRVEEEESEEEDEEIDDADSGLCTLKLRLEGKNKVHEMELDAEDTLGNLLEDLPFPVEEGEVVQFTCVAKRLIVKSTDDAQMSKTLSELKLTPSANIVVKVGEGKKSETTKGSLAERAASSKKKTTGSHSMHSIGLYAKDDGNKAETFESGGVLYDHDISDDEGEEAEENEGGEGEEEAAEGEEGEDAASSEGDEE